MTDGCPLESQKIAISG